MNAIYVGYRNNFLTVVRVLGSKKVECKCDCGNTTIILYQSIKSGNTKSCGCYKINKPKKHGLISHKPTRLYTCWVSIKSRCHNPNNANYKYYGGRGICICPEWKNDYRCFYEWAIKSGYKDWLTIDRKNHGLGYTPENCKWSTKSENSKEMNTRRWAKWNLA